MLDLLVLVILVAIFFGISLTAALHGILQAVGIIILIGIVFLFLQPWFEKLPEPAQKPQPAPQPKAIQQRTVIVKKKPKKDHNIFLWVIFFIISYLITGLFLTATEINRSTEYLRSADGTWLVLTMNMLPFIIVLSYHLIKKFIASKKRTKKN